MAGGDEHRGTLAPGPLADFTHERLRRMAEEDLVARIWRRDHTVWREDPTEIADRLGWLDVMGTMRGRVADLEAFAKEAAADGLTSAVLLGMGGSSLAPEVLRNAFGVGEGALDLLVLDTTHPGALARVEADLDLDRTLFLVASKSGTTIETRSHLAYLWERTGGDASRFAAITDPGTSLDKVGIERGFRAVFRNPEDIGGRYSALSLFGLVPGALIGAPLGALLDGAEAMAAACRAPLPENHGAWLGAVIGEAARLHRDKLTLALPSELASLGDWIEQLVAESTGKEGRGILPVVGEPIGPPEAYGTDRLFVAVGEHGGLDALQAAGHPVVRLPGAAPEDLGREFFRWEMATAVAGHILEIHPFDQPNVAEAKEATSRILEEGWEDPGFDDPSRLLVEVRPGDYLAILAYLHPTDVARAELQGIRMTLRDRLRVATTIGFGPRYLHSTGQLHKGGPATGVFVQVVDEEPPADRDIPGAPSSFGELLRAQALGDLRSLRARGRRVARTTLERLREVV
jgi:transaldolase / glucose-6-phosphate isomerase